MSARTLGRVALTAAMCLFADTVIHACPVCFQIEDAHLTSGVRAAVGVLMGVTLTVLAPVVVFAVRFAR